MTMNFKWLALLGALISTPALATPAAPAHYPSPLSCTRNFYVAPGGSDRGGCGSQTNACATPWGADANISLTGGDCVNVAAGTYTTGGEVGFTKSGNQNTSSGHIQYIGAPNHASKLVMGSPSYAMMNVTGSYISLDGFEIDGHNQQGFNGYNPGNRNTYNASQQIFDRGGGSHHHMLLNNIFHGTGGSCTGSVGSDYEIVIANECYDAAGANCYHASGMEWYEPTAIPNFNATLPWDKQRFHLQLIGNVIHDVGESALCGGHTDGNGIIMDDFIHEQNAPRVPYPFEALVAYNVVYKIGGRGVYVMSGRGITLINNVAYNVGLDLGGGASPFQEYCATGDTWTNNIGISTGGRSSATWTGAWCGASWNSTSSWKNNLFTGGPVSTDGNRSLNGNGNQIGADPKLTNIAAADFHPLAGSPVLGTGSTVPSGLAFVTPDGFVPSSPPNIGPFNLAGTSGPPVILPPPGDTVASVAGPVSINAGGSAATPFIADAGFNGGDTISNGTGVVDVSAVTNPAPNEVYQSERYGTFKYVVKNLTPANPYTVNLHFTEDWPADEAVGQRLENVDINGSQVLTNFDIFAAAGAANKAVIKTFPAVADASGNISIAFAPSATSVDQSAKVDGIEVLNLSGVPTTTKECKWKIAVNTALNINLVWVCQ